MRGRTRRHRDALGRFFVQIRQLNQHIGQVFLDCDLIRTGDIGLIALVLYICADVQRGNRLIAILSLVKGTPLDGQGLDSGVRTAEISGARAIFAAAGRDFDNRLVTAIAVEGGVLDVDNRILNTNQVQVDGVIAGGVRSTHRTSSIVLKRAAGHGQFLGVGQVQGFLDIVLNGAVLQRQGKFGQVVLNFLVLCNNCEIFLLIPVQSQVFQGELGITCLTLSSRSGAGDLAFQRNILAVTLNHQIGAAGDRDILSCALQKRDRGFLAFFHRTQSIADGGIHLPFHQGHWGNVSRTFFAVVQFQGRTRGDLYAPALVSQAHRHRVAYPTGVLFQFDIKSAGRRMGLCTELDRGICTLCKLTACNDHALNRSRPSLLNVRLLVIRTAAGCDFDRSRKAIIAFKSAILNRNLRILNRTQV